MNAQRNAGLAVIVAGAIAAPGCSDSTGPSGLSQQASMEIATTLMLEIIDIGFSALDGAFDGGVGPVVAADARGALADVITTTISESVPCEAGGTIVLEGTHTSDFDDVGTGSVAFNLAQRPINCVMSTSSGTFTVNGSPALTVEGMLSTSNWNLGIFTMAYGGGFSWNGPGGSGSCNMDLTYNFNYATYVFSGSGHICGHNVTYSYP